MKSVPYVMMHIVHSTCKPTYLTSDCPRVQPLAPIATKHTSHHLGHRAEGKQGKKEGEKIKLNRIEFLTRQKLSKTCPTGVDFRRTIMVQSVKQNKRFVTKNTIFHWSRPGRAVAKRDARSRALRHNNGAPFPRMVPSYGRIDTSNGAHGQACFGQCISA